MGAQIGSHYRCEIEIKLQHSFEIEKLKGYGRFLLRRAFLILIRKPYFHNPDLETFVDLMKKKEKLS